MRIVYGVFGYGRGHATRALSLLPELRRRHDVVVLAGGDALDALATEHPVVPIPTLRYEYGPDGKRSLSRTLGENLKHVVDVSLGGEAFRGVVRLMRKTRPDVAICDAEPWCHAAAAHLGVPRISLDHFGLLAYCRPAIDWADRLRSLRDVTAYRALMGGPTASSCRAFTTAARAIPGCASWARCSVTRCSRASLRAASISWCT